MSKPQKKPSVALWPAAVLAAFLFAVSPIFADEVGQRKDREARQTPEVAPDSVKPRTSHHRTADEIVDEVESQLKISRRALPSDDFNRTHNKIAELVDELRSVYPDDHRVAKFLPERWLSLNFSQRRGEACGEIDNVLKTTLDPLLKTDALFFQTALRFLEPIDSPIAVSLAETFARQSPDDNRAGGLLYMAAMKLNEAWYIRIVLVVVLAVISTLAAATARDPLVWLRTRWMLAILLGLSGLSVLVAALCAIRLWSDPQHAAESVRDAVEFALLLVYKVSDYFRVYVWTSRTAVAVFLAGVGALILVLFRRRSPATPMRWTAALRLWLVGLSAALAVSCALDAFFIARQAALLRQRIVHEYPDSGSSRSIQGQDRRRKQVGERFDLDFTDAISGEKISLKQLRGKVVVVDFWATWCGPCVVEIPEMKRVYAKYHDIGVEFIGVSHDLPEEDGGLAALQAFVAKEGIAWPQFYEARNSRAILTGSAMNDFSESWGIEGIPTVFLIDADGKLYSTEARGKLEALIPKLLKASEAKSP